MSQPVPSSPNGAEPAPFHVTPLPRHVAIIMDGNGRWAEQQGLPREAGHAEGAKAVNRTVRACRQLGIEVLTVYAFSEQNWSRPDYEVNALMQLLHDYVHEERWEILNNNIRLTTIGDIERLPSWVRKPLKALCDDSQNNQGMVLALALSYGSREEIMRGIRQLASQIADGTLDPEALTEDHLSAQLYTASWPDPDLIIRTSGEERLSNFMLWQAAYAELYFTPVPWPDFGLPELEAALRHYAGRQRRFGRTGAQIEESTC